MFAIHVLLFFTESSVAKWSNHLLDCPGSPGPHLPPIVARSDRRAGMRCAGARRHFPKTFLVTSRSTCETTAKSLLQSLSPAAGLTTQDFAENRTLFAANRGGTDGNHQRLDRAGPCQCQPVPERVAARRPVSSLEAEKPLTSSILATNSNARTP